MPDIFGQPTPEELLQAQVQQQMRRSMLLQQQAQSPLERMGMAFGSAMGRRNAGAPAGTQAAQERQSVAQGIDGTIMSLENALAKAKSPSVRLKIQEMIDAKRETVVDLETKRQKLKKLKKETGVVGETSFTKELNQALQSRAITKAQRDQYIAARVRSQALNEQITKEFSSGNSAFDKGLTDQALSVINRATSDAPMLEANLTKAIELIENARASGDNVTGAWEALKMPFVRFAEDLGIDTGDLGSQLNAQEYITVVATRMGVKGLQAFGGSDSEKELAVALGNEANLKMSEEVILSFLSEALDDVQNLRQVSDQAFSIWSTEGDDSTKKAVTHILNSRSQRLASTRTKGYRDALVPISTAPSTPTPSTDYLQSLTNEQLKALREALSQQAQ